MRHFWCKQVHLAPLIGEDQPAQLCIKQGRHVVLEVAFDSPLLPSDTSMSPGQYTQLISAAQGASGVSKYTWPHLVGEDQPAQLRIK